MDLSLIARITAVFGLILLVVAGLLYIMDKLDLPLGRLPGDLNINKGNFKCVAPIVSSLIISVILTVVVNLLLLFLKK